MGDTRAVCVTSGTALSHALSHAGTDAGRLTSSMGVGVWGKGRGRSVQLSRLLLGKKISNVVL